jgi:hypothetical protein
MRSTKEGRKKLKGKRIGRNGEGMGDIRIRIRNRK